MLYKFSVPLGHTISENVKHLGLIMHYYGRYYQNVINNDINTTFSTHKFWHNCALCLISSWFLDWGFGHIWQTSRSVSHLWDIPLTKIFYQSGTYFYMLLRHV